MQEREFQAIWEAAVAAGEEAHELCNEQWACGFAWVNIKPGTSRFARWLKKKNYARTDSYYGGVTYWVATRTQCVMKKESYARAMAKVLTDAGFRAYAQSRLD